MHRILLTLLISCFASFCLFSCKDDRSAAEDDDDDNDNNDNDDDNDNNDDDNDNDNDDDNDSDGDDDDDDNNDNDNDDDSGDVKKYAVVVGISDYAGGGQDLYFADDDAADWYTYLDGLGYDVTVLGHPNESDYPKYDGLATKPNVRSAIKDMMAKTDSDDLVVIAYSGHGYGEGGSSSVITQDGIQYMDTELAADVKTGEAGQVFAFFDTCMAGGMGPELINLDSDAVVWVGAGCGPNGVSLDYDGNGLWTSVFLNQTLKVTHSGENVAMETAFTEAKAIHMYKTGVNAPVEFDEDEDESFYLDYPFPPPPEPAPALDDWQGGTAEAAALLTPETLDTYLHGRRAVKAALTSWRLDGQKTLGQADIEEPSTVESIYRMLDPDQPLSAAAARCLFDYSLEFSDDNSNLLGVVGICISEEPSLNHVAVFMPADLEGKLVRRMGIAIPNAGALVRVLDRKIFPAQND